MRSRIAQRIMEQYERDKKRITMKKLFNHFFAQRYSKPMLVGVAAVMVIWTWAWSKQDGRFNYDMLLIGPGFVLFVLFCTWLELKVKAWRTGKK